MIKEIKKKFLPTALAAIMMASTIGCETAEAKPWAFDQTWYEATSLQNPELPNGGSIISLSFRDTDVRQILRMFADKAGLNIVFIGSVSGNVTMDLVDTTLSDAINLVAESSSLTYLVDNQTLIVMSVATAKTNNYAKKSMRIIPIKYSDAASVAKFLNTNVFGLGKPGISAGNNVVPNPDRNDIIIYGADNDYNMAINVIGKLDIKPNSTTYKINHVTPKEMATLICDSLFPSTANSGYSKLAGVFTGAAADAKALSIGAGTVACKIENKVTAGSLESFNSPPITVMYNSGLGTLNVIGGSGEQIQLINEFVLLHDKKQPQAVLEFAVLELNENGSQTFQNEWHFTNNTFPVSFENGVLKLGSIIFFGQDTNNTTGLNKGGQAALWDTITWIEETGKGKLLQKPTIVVTNGAESTIDLTQDYIEKTDSQVSESTYSTIPVVTRTYTIGKDQGMKMGITPFISPDGYVTMNITAEYSTPYSTETGVDALGNTYTAATLLERRNLKLNSVRVKNGETLVLGGLIYENEVQSVNKIPILGDIPGLGVFFRNTDNAKQKNELVIMITPRLLEDTEDALDI